jgi:hypothetical protein
MYGGGGGGEGMRPEFQSHFIILSVAASSVALC